MITMGNSDIIDLDVIMRAETAAAILVAETEDALKAVWLPKSQIEIERKIGSRIVTITLPEWLATDKGLV